MNVTRSIPNYKTFDFFYIKFDHLLYSKFYINYYFFIMTCFTNKNSLRIT